MAKRRFGGSAFALALLIAAAPAFADASADCRKAPTRACVLEAAEAAVEPSVPPFLRASLFGAIAAAEQRAGLSERAAATLARAIEAEKQIPADFEAGSFAPGILSARAEMGDIASALDRARGLDKPLARAFALAGVAAALQRQGRADEAKAVFAQAVEAAEAAPIDRREFLLISVARAEARVGSLDAPETFDRAMAAAKAAGKGGGAANVIDVRIRVGEYARAYVDIGDLPQDSRDRSLLALVTAQAAAGEIADAAAVAPSISDDSERITAYANLAVAEFRAGQTFASAQMLVKAQSLAEAQTIPAEKGEAAAAMAGAEAVGGMTSRAKAHIAEASAALEAETAVGFRWALTKALSLALARSGETQEAIDLVRTRADAWSQPGMLYDIAADLTAAKRPDEAFAALAAIPNADMRGGMLLEFAEKLGE